MTIFPGCKCCGPCWRCYTNGLAYECVGPDDTPQDGWGPVGKCHPTEEECAENCATGACCHPDGTCTDSTKDECDGVGGSWQGADTECATTVCLGACCHPDGTCTDSTKDECDGVGGAWHAAPAECATTDCSDDGPPPYTTGCCTGGELIRCVDINTGLEIVCPSCGDPDWGYEVGEIYWTCWEEPDAEWCKEQEAADPSTYRFLDDYCNTAFYSDVQGSTFPVEDCPETAEFYGPDPFSSCVPIRREVETPSGKIMFDIKPLPEEALERLKRDNPLP